MNRFEEFYNRQQELSKAYKTTPTRETAEYCKTEMDAIWKEITSKGIAFTAMFKSIRWKRTSRHWQGCHMGKGCTCLPFRHAHGRS